MKKRDSRLFAVTLSVLLLYEVFNGTQNQYFPTLRIDLPVNDGADEFPLLGSKASTEDEADRPSIGNVSILARRGCRDLKYFGSSIEHCFYRMRGELFFISMSHERAIRLQKKKGFFLKKFKNSPFQIR